MANSPNPFDFTVINDSPTSFITPQCFEWCQAQHFIHTSNLNTQALFPVAIALAAFVTAYIIYENATFIGHHTGHTQERLGKVFALLLQFGILVLFGFFIWRLYFV